MEQQQISHLLQLSADEIQQLTLFKDCISRFSRYLAHQKGEIPDLLKKIARLHPLQQAVKEGFYTKQQDATLRGLYGEDTTDWEPKLTQEIVKMLQKEILPKISFMLSAIHKLLDFATKMR